MCAQQIHRIFLINSRLSFYSFPWKQFFFCSLMKNSYYGGSQHWVVLNKLFGISLSFRYYLAKFHKSTQHSVVLADVVVVSPLRLKFS